MVAEAVNTVVSLASDTVKPKLTTEEWTTIAVPNYKLQIDSGNGKGLERSVSSQGTSSLD